MIARANSTDATMINHAVFVAASVAAVAIAAISGFALDVACERIPERTFKRQFWPHRFWLGAVMLIRSGM
jgi:hypothetical protein